MTRPPDQPPSAPGAEAPAPVPERDPTAGVAHAATAGSTWSVDASRLQPGSCDRCGKPGTTDLGDEPVCPGCLMWQVLSRGRTPEADAARAALEALGLVFATASDAAPGAELVSAPDGGAFGARLRGLAVQATVVPAEALAGVGAARSYVAVVESGLVAVRQAEFEERLEAVEAANGPRRAA